MPADFDREIDRAVDAMLDGEPSPALRARVIAHLGPARRQWRVMWLVAPLAAAAIVLAVLTPWRPVEAPAPIVARAADVPLPSAAVARPAPVVPVAPAVEPRTVPRVAAVHVPEPRRESQTVAAASLALPDTSADQAIAPLKSMDAIAPRPIAPEAFAPASIAVAPLTPITTLQIAPLNPDGRN